MSDDAPTMHRTSYSRVALVALATLALVLPPAAVLGAEEEPFLDQELIAEAIELLRERYVDEEVLTSENLTVGAIRGMVEALGDDGHTQYLTEEEYEIERDVLQGRIAGIGVVLDQRSASPVVVSVVDGSPADRAGLRAGDVIVTVGGVETARMPDGELADRVRGEPDTVVRLGLERPGSAERVVVDVRRGDVEIDPVSWAFAPGSDVAVVRVVQFSVGSGRQTREAVEDAVATGATGIVLDLRGNPGGLLTEMVNAASAFLEEGVVLLERGRDDMPEPISVDPGRAVDTDAPVVVLVDYGTASSAEILAAALRDNGRAMVIGEQTFGTGTILNNLRLSDGSALRLGVREWLTPDGQSLFRVGLAPDEEASLPPGAVRHEPSDLLSLTPLEFEVSDDEPLRRAVQLAESGSGELSAGAG